MPYVYIFQSGATNYFKIGRARDVEQRRRELSTGNPHQLTLFDSIETDEDTLVEKYLHAKFAEYSSIESDATEYFLIDPEELKRGLEEAKVFLADYIDSDKKVASFRTADSTGELKAPDEEVQALYKQIRLIRSRLGKLVFERDLLENKMRSKIADADGIESVVTWKTQVSPDFDEKRFRQDHPELYEQYTRLIKSRPFRLWKG